MVPAPPTREKTTTQKPTPAPAPQRAVIGSKASSGNNSLSGYWKGDKATELTRFIDMMFREDGTGKREEKLFKWDLEDNKKLTINWLELIASSKYIKVMNDAESMQTVSQQVKIYVVDGKNITIVELNDKYYEVVSKDVYDVITLNDTSLKLSFKTAKGQIIQMSHTKQ